MSMTDVAENTSLAESSTSPATELDQVTGTYVTFELAGQLLGASVSHVREILDCVSIAQLPNSPTEIEGLIDIRGESIPVIDMGSRLGLPRQEQGTDTRIIVFEITVAATTRPVGVFADRVRDVLQISSEMIENPPEISTANWDPKLLLGIARHDDALLLLLNVDHVFGGSSSGFGGIDASLFE